MACVFLQPFLPLGVDVGLILRLSDLFLVFAIAQFLLKGSAQFRQINQNNLFLSISIFSLYTLLNMIVNNTNMFNIVVEFVQLIYLLSFLCLCNTRTLSSLQISLLVYALLLVVIFVILYHVSIGHYIYYKEVNTVKPLFGLAPSCVYLRFRDQRKLGWKLIFLVFIVILIFSGERKAQLGCSCALAIC